MAPITKFSFDTDFDAVDSSRQHVVEEEAPLPEPMFSEADVAAARQSGFTEGHKAGAAEVMHSVENTVAQTLTVISDQLGSIGLTFTKALQRSRQEAIDIARAITRKMVADEKVATVLPSIEAVITQILPRIMDEPRVVIRVSDDILDSLRERLPSVTQKCGFPGSLILLAEQELSSPDCRIEWADGGAEYDSQSLWSELDGMIERYLAGIGIEEEQPVDSETAVADAAPIETTNSEEHTNG